MRTSLIALFTVCIALISSTQIHSQVCPVDFEWENYIGDQIPSDVSYSSIKDNPLVADHQIVNIFNTNTTGGASILNNTVSTDQTIGSEPNAYIMGLNGDMTDWIRVKIEFQPEVYDLSLKLLDIDRHSGSFWQDSVRIDAYSGAVDINVGPQNIRSMGSSVKFNNIVDAFIGLRTEENPSGVRGNVELNFPGPIDSLVILYTYGPSSHADKLGNQIVGIANMHFSSGDACEGPMSNDDVYCAPSSIKVHNMCILDNDQEGSNPLDYSSISITDYPEYGNVFINTTTGCLSYLPKNDYAGMDVLTYQVCDELGQCSSAEVEIFVGTKHTLYAKNDHYPLIAKTSVTGNIFENDFDNNEESFFLDDSKITLPENGSFNIMPNGDIEYIPNINFVGVDVVNYEICKSNDSEVCSKAKIYFYVKPVLLPNEETSIIPNGEGYAYSGQSFSFNVPIGALDLNLFYFGIKEAPKSGIGTISTDGVIEYTSEMGFVGCDQISFAIMNLEHEIVHEGEFTIRVLDDTQNCDFFLPLANDDLIVLCESDEITSSLIANDFVDNMIFELNTQPLTAPQHGVLNIQEDGSYFYQPIDGFWGTDHFTYEICFKSEGITPIVYLYHVTDAPKNIPLGVSSVVSVVEVEKNEPILGISLENLRISHEDIGDISAKLIAPSGTYAWLFQGMCSGTSDMHLNFSDNADPGSPPCPLTNNGTYRSLQSLSRFIGESAQGIWQLQIIDSRPNRDAGTLDGWDLRITTGVHEELYCRTANVSILVTPKVEPPVAEDDQASTVPSAEINIDILENDSDPDNDIAICSINIDTEPSNGTVEILENCTVNYIPDDGFTGTDQFDYTICDTLGLCDDATVIIDVFTVLAAEDFNFNISSFDDKPKLIWEYHGVDIPLYFNIERNTGDGFVKIGEKENRDLVNEFIDETLVSSETTYYRIVAIMPDGKLDFSGIRSYEGTFNPEFVVYPNPFVQSLEIDLGQGNLPACQVRIFDNLGLTQRRMEAGQGERFIKMTDLGSLTPGVYFLSIEIGDQTVVQRVIKI